MKNLLKDSLRRFVTSTPQRSSGPHTARVIAVAAQKGGVGKTTTSVNLACALVRFENARVLLLDLDPQNHVHTALRANVKSGGRPVSDALLQENRAVDIADLVTSTHLDGLRVLPEDPALSETENLLAARIGKETRLQTALENARTWYDYILIDCPPHVGNLTLNALCAADYVLVPTDLAPLATDGVISLLQSITNVSERLNPDLDLAGVVITRYDSRNQSVNESAERALTHALADAICPVRISVSTAVPKAQREGIDLYSFDEKSRPAQQYRELAQWIVQRCGGR
jgi:chromosome partitioning protein